MEDKVNKVKKGYRSRKKHRSSAAKLPENTDEVSGNWKQLLKQMESDNKGSHKNSQKAKRKFQEKSSTREVKPKVDIWFDGVDESLLDPDDRPSENSFRPTNVTGEMEKSGNTKALVKEKSFEGLTKVIGIDCEMVGVGFNGEESILARVSLVNRFGHCIYDKYVMPTETVTDYRTNVSGIRPQDIQNGSSFKTVQKEVSDILNGRILVGHSLKHDLKVLFLTHPKRMIRDTSLYKPFRAAFNGKTPSLKNLTARMIGINVQEGEHSSVQDAQAAMRLYTMVKKDWEKEIVKRRSRMAAAKVHIRTETRNEGKQDTGSGKKPLYEDSD